MTASERPPSNAADDACEEHPIHARARAPLSAEVLERAAAFFRAIGDAERLRMLVELAASEVCVSDLAATLGESLSTVSQRLRVLRSEGLVRRRREGKHVYYALADAHVRDLVETALAHAGEVE
jgi:ArsR family transcriptional regulator